MPGTVGFGTSIAYDDIGSSTFGDSIGQIRDVSGPNQEATDVDLTHNEVADQTRDFLPGLNDAGEVTFDIIMEKAIVTAVEALYRVPKAFKITLPDGSSWTFNGYIKALGNEAPMDDAVTIPVTIKVNTKPTWAAAA